MSIPGAASPLLLAATAAVDAGPFKINRSLRFNSADSAYLGRTPSSASNRKTFTFSAWVKRHKLGADQKLFGVNSAWFTFYFTSSDNLRIYYENSGSQYFTTDAVFRDPSAWYHIVLKVDTTQSTASDRVKIYVNSEELTFSATGTTSQNYEFGVNTTNAHDIGMRSSESNMKADFGLADVYFIDGQALAPTDFGEYDDNNNWNPKAYSGGSYGTNGFHLDFSDASSNSALGDDSSGNNNDWTVNNLVADGGVIYSAYGSGTVSGTKTFDKAFDGSTSTFCEPNDNQTITFDFTDLPGGGIAVSSSLRIYLNKAGTPAAGHFTVNGTNLGGSVPSGAYLTISSVTLLETITFFHQSGSSSVELYAVEVDGAVLQDGTPSNTDSLIDTPTNYDAASGNNGGNYPTFNPLSQQYSTANHVLTNGNLQVGDSSTSKGNYALEIATMAAPPSGKWYWEMTLDDKNSAERRCIGVVASDADFATYLPQDNLDDGFVGLWCETGQKIINGSRTSYGASATDGDIIGVALDQDGDTVTFYKNNSSQGSISLPTNMQGKSIFPAVISIQADENVIGNWGQRQFAYTPPTNHKSLCTQNLPDPTIADGSDYFEAKLYTGNGSTQSITGLSFSPDWVWTAVRDSTGYIKYLWDTVRGATKALASSHIQGDDAESTVSNGLTSFDSSGFSLGSNGQVNENNRSMVAWCWDGGTSTVSNTDGSQTTNVRANQSAGFSICTYSGGGSGTANSDSGDSFGHGLNAAPDLVICKKRSGVNGWPVYHSAAPTGALILNATNANDASSFLFAKKDPSSSVVYLGNNPEINATGSTYVAYCFTAVAGYSAFGGYDGNGSNDGPFVYTGFRPKWLMLKCHNATELWMLHDSSRDVNNVVSRLLQPHTNDAEIDSVTNYGVDFLSNGFKLRSSTNRNNGSGKSYVFACFAEHPFKTARAR